MFYRDDRMRLDILLLGIALVCGAHRAHSQQRPTSPAWSVSASGDARRSFGGALSRAAADTIRYVVDDHGRRMGDMIVVRSGESTAVSYHGNCSGHAEARYHILADGSVVGAQIQSFTADGQPDGPASRIDLVGDSVRRTGANDVRTTRAERGTYYGHVVGMGPYFFLGTFSGTLFEQALLARFLLREPQHTAKFPDGTVVHLDVVKDTTMRTKAGRQRLRFVTMSGTGNTPQGIWLDRHEDAFASSQVRPYVTVRAGAESVLATLRAIETTFRATQAEALSHRLAEPVNGALVISNGDLFDSERGVVRPRTTVVIEKDRIVAVGPADSVAIPARATVIDATGKSIVPGLWDMHGHLMLTSETSRSVSHLSHGVTTVRDLASDVDVAVSQRDRAQTRRIAGPRQLLSAIIEGPGKCPAPFEEALVRTDDEARRWVARFDSMGYRQVKLYNLVPTELVPTIVEEAHKRGMRVSGHIPRGLSVPAAVSLGFDEIQHAAFLFSTFYQDSLYVPMARPYSAVARAVAPNIDVDGQAMTGLINFLAQHHTVIDGTFNLYIEGRGSGMQPALPAVLPSNAEKAEANYLRLIKRLRDAGITMVPGTDNLPQAYNDELELYERAGIPAPQVLQMATIVSARVMRDDRDYGSIVAGKVADLIIVDGKPAEHVADLRQVQVVVRGGRLYNVQELRAASGLP